MNRAEVYVITIYVYTPLHHYIYRYTHFITSGKFRLNKKTWRLTKAIAEMKSETE